MNILEAIVLGVVEGLTEFLPVSSTGHLILVGHWLGIDDAAHKAQVDAFDVVVQLGAIIAVLVHYRTLLATRLRGLVRGEAPSIALLRNLVVAFLPAAIVGFLFHKKVEALLFGPIPVAGALIAGGLLMIAVEMYVRRRTVVKDTIDDVTLPRAGLIGLGQCISLWPGTSRSMSTMVSAQLTGLSTATAAEFSFLLALPTLGAATVYKMIKSRHVLLASTDATIALVVGLVVSFLVAWAVIAAFLRYLRNRGLVPFGIYRIVLGVCVLVLMR